MKIYHYDRETNEYIGETEARLDPLELELNKIERWLLPAYATFTKPPEVEEGKKIVYQNGKWEIIDIPIPEQEPIYVPTAEQIIESKIRAEMDRILREQVIASLKAKGEI